MKEAQRLISLFEKLYSGSPWIDVNLLSTLESISSSQANQRILPKCNTIWEITNHIIAWRKNVLQRVKGHILITPTNNYFEPVTDNSQEAWATTLMSLKDSQDEWTDFLRKLNSHEFDKIYENNSMTYYEHIHGILQHDAYHLGQIVLLAKQFDS